MPLLPGPSLFSSKLLLILALSLIRRKPSGHSAGGHSGCSAPGEEGRASSPQIPPALIPHSSETCGRDMSQRPGPLRDGPAAPPGRAIELAAIPGARGIPLAGSSEVESGVPRQRGGVGLGRPVPRRANRAPAWGRAAPSRIPHPKRRIPHRAAPQGPRAPFPLRGCRRWGGRRVGAGPPRAPPQGEREGPSPAPPGAPPLRYLAGTGSTGSALPAARGTGGGRTTLGTGLLGRGV